MTTQLAELFDDPIALMERALIPPAAPDVITKAISGARSIAQILRGPNPAAIAPLIGLIVQRIDVAADAVTITLNNDQIPSRLGVVQNQETNRHGAASPLQIIVSAKLKRSGLAMRLILPSGEKVSSHIDESLVTAIATAHRWWGELLRNPELRVSDLARSQGISKSWVTRMLRLAFLDPSIVEQVLDGKAPAHLTLETLRMPESVPALWSAQRTHHRIAIA